MASNSSNNNNHQRSSSRSLFEIRDVQCAGWLKYIPFAQKYTSSSSNDYKFWVVFTIYGLINNDNSYSDAGQQPYLEFYQQPQRNFITKRNNNNDDDTNVPISKHSLINCKHINAEIEYDHSEFSITLSTHVIRLVADNDEIMWDWINCLRTKLLEMNILNPSENLYSKNPELSVTKPSFNPQQQSTTIGLPQTSVTTTTTTNQDDQLYEPIFSTPNTFRRILSNFQQQRQQQPQQQRQHQQTTIPAEEGPPPYECIFENNPISGVRNNSSKHYRGSIVSSHRPSFRELQVEKFKKEMGYNCLKLEVRKKDCYNSIAFVDLQPFGVFIAGWKQKDHPYLHNTFHIGDQLININGTAMESSSDANQFIKKLFYQNNNHYTIDITIRRVPFGQIFCLKRSYDGEDLGLLRSMNKGTAEIIGIRSNSPASECGIPSKCHCFNDNFFDHYQPLSDERSNNWFITEINNRPLNLFFKNNEVNDRLNAMGKEISILIQPYGFIKRLKKQFKSVKNYKDYIVQ